MRSWAFILAVMFIVSQAFARGVPGPGYPEAAAKAREHQPQFDELVGAIKQSIPKISAAKLRGDLGDSLGIKMPINMFPTQNGIEFAYVNGTSYIKPVLLINVDELKKIGCTQKKTRCGFSVLQFEENFYLVSHALVKDSAQDFVDLRRDKATFGIDEIQYAHSQALISLAVDRLHEQDQAEATRAASENRSAQLRQAAKKRTDAAVVNSQAAVRQLIDGLKKDEADR